MSLAHWLIFAAGVLAGAAACYGWAVLWPGVCARAHVRLVRWTHRLIGEDAP